MSDNQQRAAELAERYATPLTLVREQAADAIAAALDAAEARGRAEVAAKVQEILDTVPVSITARDHLRALVAELVPGAQTDGEAGR